MRDLQNSGNKPSLQPELIAIQSNGEWGWMSLRQEITFNTGNVFEDPTAPDTRFSSLLPGGYIYSAIQYSSTQIISLASLLVTARSYRHYHSPDILLLNKNSSRIVPATPLGKLQSFTQATRHNTALCPVHRP